MSFMPATQFSPTDLRANILKSNIPDSQSGGVAGFLKCDFKTGMWLFGREGDDVTGAQFLVNTPSIGHGWVLWNNGTPEKNMASVFEPMPAPMPAAGGNEPTQGRTLSGIFYPVEAGEAPLNATFDTNSYGGRKGVDNLRWAIRSRAEAVPDTDYLYPLVELSSESYVHKQHGSEIHNPVFKIIGWFDSEGKSAPDALASDTPSTQEEKPQNTRRRRRATS